MGYTNETTHYSIPLPLGSDKTTPMDYNTSAQEVDTVLFEAKTDSASALQKANQLQQDLATTNGNVTAVTGRVTTLEGTVTTQGQSILQNTQDISDVRADALDMIVAKDEGTAQVATVAVAEGEYFRYNDVLYIATQAIAVGDTIVPNTNCKATNVGTELNQLNSDLNKGSVSVTADGVKTVKQLLNELYALVNLSKVTKDSKIVVEYSTGSLVYHLMKIQESDLFYLHNMSTSAFDIVNLRLATGSNSGTYTVSGTTPTFGNSDSYVWTNGTKYELFY